MLKETLNAITSYSSDTILTSKQMPQATDINRTTAGENKLDIGSQEDDI